LSWSGSLALPVGCSLWKRFVEYLRIELGVMICYFVDNSIIDLKPFH
jgi:hypothetical protein